MRYLPGLALAAWFSVGFACTSSYGDSARTQASATQHELTSSRRPPREGARRVATRGLDLDVVDDAGESLRAFEASGRIYVLGNAGERYRIRVRNPTGRRVEAVVSVDGLDVIDGRPASFEKRGYLIGPYESILIEGFRTSLDEVAAFRFSSVADSYAARKGLDRNVGVIGVAFFPERFRPPPPPPPRRPVLPYPRGRAAEDEAPRYPSAPPSSGAAEARPESKRAESQRAPAEERPGLGTEFGERHLSEVSYAPFERENARRPAWTRELRYNDRDGLLALGLPVDDEPRWDEVQTRETADPFPGRRFASPPP